MSPVRRAAGLSLVACSVLVACAGSGRAAPDDAAAAAPAPVRPDVGDDGALPPAGPVAVREADVTDVDQLASSLAAAATGDPAWIAAFSQLRARGWLASRYPGRYDLDEIYADDAAEVAGANEAQNLSLGVYLDEPLPLLVSVTKTRDLGELVELDVLLDAGPATVRAESDDLPRGVLPGGTHRGLFTIGRDGPGGRWRIHSVTELLVDSRPTGQEPQ